MAGVHVAHAKRHITVPEDVLRMSVGGRVVFISHCATSVRREAREYRAEQARRRVSRRIRSQTVPEIERRESVLHLISNFLSNLAAQDNKRLQCVQESRKAAGAAEASMERSKKEIIEALRTFV